MWLQRRFNHMCRRLLEFEAMGHWANYVAAHMTSITNCTVHSMGWQDEPGAGRSNFYSVSLRAGT